MYAKVKSISRIKKETEVFNIETEDNHNYVANGILVHNCDDPDSLTDLPSKTYRENNTTYFDEVLSTRHSGDPAKFRMLVVQQRAHSQDISGHILSKQDERWIHLRLPMEFDAEDVCETIPLYDPVSRKVRLWRDPRTLPGEILWPEMLTPEDVRLMKEKDFRGNPYVIAGQLQQRPVPKGGGIFRDEWFRIWNHVELPNMDMIIQSWDTAFSSSSSSACSAVLTLGIFRNTMGVRNVFLLSAFQDRLQFPELKQMAQRLYNNIYDVKLDQPLQWKSALRPDVILVEGKASGYSLIQEMERMTLPVTRFEPARYGDKESRARRVADVVENGMVWLNSNKTGNDIPDSFGQMLLRETSVFPAGETMDMVDAFSQALIYLKDRNILYFHGPAVTGLEDELMFDRQNGASF